MRLLYRNHNWEAGICLPDAALRPMMALMDEIIELTRTFGMQRNLGLALTFLGFAELGKGAYLQARALCQQSLSSYQQASIAHDRSFALLGLSHVHRVLGEREQARHARSPHSR